MAFRELVGVSDVAGGSVFTFFPLGCALHLTYVRQFYLTMALPIFLVALCAVYTLASK